MKPFLFFLLLASSALRAEDNYIDGGARQEHGGTKPVVLSATNVGTTTAGNALLVPTVSFTTPYLTAGTLTSTAVTSSGSVTANDIWITFLLSADFVGTINGVAYTGASVLAFTLPSVPGYKYPAITYTRSAGTLTITTFQ